MAEPLPIAGELHEIRYAYLVARLGALSLVTLDVDDRAR